MAVYRFSEARQQLASLLEKAVKDGEVRILRKDGVVFVLRPAEDAKSPLDVAGINADLTAEDIVSAVHEGRRRPPKVRRA
jgi:PAS domain-containing protein